MEGESVVSERVAQRWFHHFNTGEENTKDLPRSGRPQKNTRRPSEELGASKDTIIRQINTLGKSYRRRRSVPHELTPQQAHPRMDVCPQLIGNPMDDRFIRGIVSVMKNGSITATLTLRKSGSLPVNMSKSSLKYQFGLKVMFYIWWNFEGMIHWEFVPNGRAVDGDL